MAEQYRAKLLGFALRRLRDRAQAEDAVHDALVAALEGVDRFGGRALLGTWLAGILKHKIVDRMRESARVAQAEPEPDGIASCDDDPARIAWRHEILRQVECALSEVPARAAQVFMLRDVHGMSTAEACRELAISAANCAVLLHRARRRLRARLAAEGLGSGA